MSNVRRPRDSLSLPEARRIALAAQGFARSRTTQDPDRANVVRTLGLDHVAHARGTAR